MNDLNILKLGNNMNPLIFFFTIVPATEFYLLFKIGGEIGAFNTFAVIILTGVVGATLAKAQGLSVFIGIQRELANGKMPTKQILHGFLVFGGGLLLLTPGFLTDAIGFCMVIPGTRHLIMQFLSRYFKQGLKNGSMQFMQMGGNSSFFYYSSSGVNPDFSEKAQARPQVNNQDGVIEAEFTRRN